MMSYILYNLIQKFLGFLFFGFSIYILRELYIIGETAIFNRKNPDKTKKLVNFTGKRLILFWIALSYLISTLITGIFI